MCWMRRWCRSRCEMPESLRQSVEIIDENCEPSLCTVLFVGGAGGSLRAGVTQNPVRLTRAVQAGGTRLTSGGAAVYVWPGGGITFMVDVTRLPAGGFGYVPTPALVAPLEFTMPERLTWRWAGMRRRSGRWRRSWPRVANMPPGRGSNPGRERPNERAGCDAAGRPAAP